jgi:hypothetical protein
LGGRTHHHAKDVLEKELKVQEKYCKVFRVHLILES